MACKKCGKCCVGFCVPRISVYNYREFCREHPSLRFFRWGGTDKLMIPVFECSNLVSNGNGERVCSDYAHRPDFCREFPERSQFRPAGCGFA